MTDKNKFGRMENVCSGIIRLRVENGWLYIAQSETPSLCFVPDHTNCTTENAIAPNTPQGESQTYESQTYEFAQLFCKVNNKFAEIIEEIQRINQSREAHSRSNKDLFDKYCSLTNQVAELSMKLNTMQSDLREFEKQKVEPLREGHQELCKLVLKNENVANENTKFTIDLIIALEKKLDDRVSIDADKHQKLCDAVAEGWQQYDKHINKIESAIGMDGSHWSAMINDRLNEHSNRLSALEQPLYPNSIEGRIEKLEQRQNPLAYAIQCEQAEVAASMSPS